MVAAEIERKNKANHHVLQLPVTPFTISLKLALETAHISLFSFKQTHWQQFEDLLRHKYMPALNAVADIADEMDDDTKLLKVEVDADQFLHLLLEEW